jgi:hypothetical protein
MFVVREIMYCKPGKVRPMVEKFLAMSKLGVKMGMPPLRVMTDFSAERYWTLVAADRREVPMTRAVLAARAAALLLVAVGGAAAVAACYVAQLRTITRR